MSSTLGILPALIVRTGAIGQVREQNPENATRDREHEAFREQLQHQPAAAGPERCADRDLFLADGRAHEQQVRNVRACDENDDRNGREQGIEGPGRSNRPSGLSAR